jgi:hypothetical protein
MQRCCLPGWSRQRRQWDRSRTGASNNTRCRSRHSRHPRHRRRTSTSPSPRKGSIASPPAAEVGRWNLHRSEASESSNSNQYIVVGTPTDHPLLQHLTVRSAAHPYLARSHRLAHCQPNERRLRGKSQLTSISLSHGVSNVPAGPVSAERTSSGAHRLFPTVCNSIGEECTAASQQARWQTGGTRWSLRRWRRDSTASTWC